MRERRWIQKGCRIFFAIALLICVGGIPAYAEEPVPDAGEITGRVLFISSYSYAWETVPEQIRGIKEALGAGVQLDYQFMDTKNIGMSCLRRRRLFLRESITGNWRRRRQQTRL